MNKNNTKILNKLNKLIDKEVENGLEDTSLIKACLAYITDKHYSLYCPIAYEELLNCMNVPYNECLPNNGSDYGTLYPSNYRKLPNGVSVYENIHLKRYDTFVHAMGKNRYISLSTYPFLEHENTNKDICYAELQLADIFENIEFGKYEINGISIDTGNSIYYVELETIVDIIDNKDELTDKFVYTITPKMGCCSGNISDFEFTGHTILKISTNKNISNNDTFILDLDCDIESIEHNLISLLDKSKLNNGPNGVFIQIDCSNDYEDVIADLVETIHWYLSEVDKYYLLITFVTKDRYYLGFINALIKYYNDGFNVNDFVKDMLDDNKSCDNHLTC